MTARPIFHSGFPDAPEGVADVVGVPQLYMEADEVDARFDKAVKVVVRPFNHQVGIQETVRPHRFSDGGADFRAEGDVVHKVAVHDVQVQPVGSGVKGTARFLPMREKSAASRDGAIMVMMAESFRGVSWLRC